jgi:hypothetical protein
MGCGGSKPATPAPETKPQETKSKTLNEYAALLQTATDADVQATVAALGVEERKKLLEALNTVPPIKTLAEYVALVETASPDELEAALSSLSTEVRKQLQEAIASYKVPPAEEASRRPEVGDRVRLLSGPHQGEIARLIKNDQSAKMPFCAQFVNGMFVWLAEKHVEKLLESEAVDRMIEFIDTDGDKSVLEVFHGVLYTRTYNPAGELKFECSGETELVVDPKEEDGTMLIWHNFYSKIPNGQEEKIKAISALFDKQDKAEDVPTVGDMVLIQSTTWTRDKCPQLIGQMVEIVGDDKGTIPYEVKGCSTARLDRFDVRKQDSKKVTKEADVPQIKPDEKALKVGDLVESRHGASGTVTEIDGDRIKVKYKDGSEGWSKASEWDKALSKSDLSRRTFCCC